MKHAAKEFKKAVWAVVSLSVLLGGIYPLAIWGIGRLFFPGKADGSLAQGKQGVIGSVLIGQPFTSPVYFHPRPSAAAYAGSRASSGGSNLGPLSRSLLEQATARIVNYRKENRLPADFPVPADACSASASGLDPHISPDNAMAQAARVARARNVSRERIVRMIELAMEDRQLGVLGEKRINVLRLNMALDREK